MTLRRLAIAAGVVVSAFAALGCLLLLAYAWLAMWITRVDWADRLFTLTVATSIITVVILLLFLRGIAPGRLSLPERFALIAALFVVTGLVAYAAFGIDSTRPVRELPEAQLVFPGATETGRGATPESGGIFGHTPAGFSRSYTTTVRHGDVLDFLNRELTLRGWTGRNEFAMTLSDRSVHEWRKGGFTFQAVFPRDHPAASGPFRTTIWGQNP